MAKKKIREQFEVAFKNGDESTIKKMLEKNPWLLDEVSHTMDAGMTEQNQIIAALGVMEDERGGAVPLNEILFSLKEDFNVRKTESEARKLLMDIEKLHLVKRKSMGWILTTEGGKICDEYLNKNLGKFDL
ncbi:MAG: hypothetical protein ACXADU_01665 [Promethearchaeota archaeon]|jgi:hypothetical protein